MSKALRAAGHGQEHGWCHKFTILLRGMIARARRQDLIIN